MPRLRLKKRHRLARNIKPNPRASKSARYAPTSSLNRIPANWSRGKSARMAGVPCGSRKPDVLMIAASSNLCPGATFQFWPFFRLTVASLFSREGPSTRWFFAFDWPDCPVRPSRPLRPCVGRIRPEQFCRTKPSYNLVSFGALSQTKKRQDDEDDYDQPNDVDNIVHQYFPSGGGQAMRTMSMVCYPLSFTLRHRAVTLCSPTRTKAGRKGSLSIAIRREQFALFPGQYFRGIK